MPSCVVCCLLLGLAVQEGAAEGKRYEVVRLRGGSAVMGEVLKEKPDSLVLDIGPEVIVVRKSDVLSRDGADAALAAAAPAGRAYGESGHLYATAQLTPQPIEELVDRFGEAVVFVKTPGGSGSGFVIDPSGHVITNAHVVEGETEITVDIFRKVGNSFRETSIDEVELVALSPFYDLALLKLPTDVGFPLQRVYLGTRDEVRQGEDVFAVGNPLGLTRSVTEGIVSNRNRNLEGQLYFQTNAEINPGNSGGPLFDRRGQVIGVTNAGFLGADGLGLAIPVNYVKDFLKNREAFVYNEDNPNTGYRYLEPPRRQAAAKPDLSRYVEQ